MATRQEIIDTIDAFLENRITLAEATKWAQRESARTPHCEDPPSALLTFIGSALFGDAIERPLKEQLLMDREVLVHGVPCPREELGKTVEAYWLAWTPWERTVLCQVRITESGERVLEVQEEGWDGNKLFFEEIPLPLKGENGPPPTREEIRRKRDAHWSGKITAEEFLHWILNQLQRESSVCEYEMLLHFYWETRREDHLFILEYIEGQNKVPYVPEALGELVEIVRKKEEEKTKEKNSEN